MHNLKYLAYLAISVFCFSNLYADSQLSLLDKDKYESLTGLKGSYFEGSSISSKSSIDLSNLEKIFGIKGQRKDGMAKFVFGRSLKMDNIFLGSDMGIKSREGGWCL